MRSKFLAALLSLLLSFACAAAEEPSIPSGDYAIVWNGAEIVLHLGDAEPSYVSAGEITIDAGIVIAEYGRRMLYLTFEDGYGLYAVELLPSGDLHLRLCDATYVPWIDDEFTLKRMETDEADALHH